MTFLDINHLILLSKPMAHEGFTNYCMETLLSMLQQFVSIKYFRTVFLRPILGLLKIWWGKKKKKRVLTLSNSTRGHFTAARDFHTGLFVVRRRKRHVRHANAVRPRPPTALRAEEASCIKPCEIQTSHSSRVELPA